MAASCTGMPLKSRVLFQMPFATNAARLRNYPQVVTRQDNDKFCEFLRTILNEQHVDFTYTRAHSILTLPVQCCRHPNPFSWFINGLTTSFI
jgi:hypothetical protein